jgi:hypothetical protein
MTLLKRGGLIMAAGCAAALIAAGAPLAAKGPPSGHPGKPEHPGKPGNPANPVNPVNPGNPGSPGSPFTHGGQPGTTSPAYGIKGPKPPKATFFATLLGKNEVSATGRRRAGAPDGQGGATITITTTGQLCFGIVVQGLDTPTMAHIHQGRNNVNGPVVVPLTQPSAGDPGASSGCVPVSDGTLLAKILKHPLRFYVDVHTTAFPNGALRGQLHKAPRD